MDSSIVEPSVPQCRHPLRRDGVRGLGKRDRVVEHRPVGWRNVRAARVRYQRLDEAVRGRSRVTASTQELTETRSVMGDSVVAVVRRGDRDR